MNTFRKIAKKLLRYLRTSHNTLYDLQCEYRIEPCKSNHLRCTSVIGLHSWKQKRALSRARVWASNVKFDAFTFLKHLATTRKSNTRWLPATVRDRGKFDSLKSVYAMRVPIEKLLKTTANILRSARLNPYPRGAKLEQAYFYSTCRLPKPIQNLMRRI